MMKGNIISSYISDKSIVSKSAILGENLSIWHFTQILDNSSIGENTRIGSYVYIDSNVKVGRNCKIQNCVQIYDPAEIEDGVFIGPNVILTNDKYPRATTDKFELKKPNDWNKVGVTIGKGASIGASSICIGPVRIGNWAVIGAGSVVLKNVPDFALVVGNPGKQVGWVGTYGVRLENIEKNLFLCPKTKTIYTLIAKNKLSIGDKNKINKIEKKKN